MKLFLPWVKVQLCKMKYEVFPSLGEVVCTYVHGKVIMQHIFGLLLKLSVVVARNWKLLIIRYTMYLTSHVGIIHVVCRLHVFTWIFCFLSYYK